MKKILVCAPTSVKKHYCMYEWHTRVQALTYQNKEVFLADNSEDSSVMSLYHKLGIYSKRINPKGKSNIEYMCQSHNACRDYFLENGFDAMLHLETDVLPPQNVIERLLDHRKDIVTGVYHYKLGWESSVLLQHVEADGLTIREVNSVEWGDIHEIDGSTKEVFSTGIGCALIQRKVLEKVKFRWQKDIFMHPDSFFMNDCHFAGFKVYADTSVLCDHMNQAWTVF